MKQTVSSLQAIKKWLEDEVLCNVQMQQPEYGELLNNYKLVKPAVHIGMIPPGSFLPNETGESSIRVPCLVVGVPESSVGEESTEIHVRITAIIYDPGHQTNADGILQSDLNFDGYLTLLNLLDKVRSFVAQGIIADIFELSSPVKLKTYDEQIWPYWYGYLDFVVIGEAYPRVNYTQILE